MFTVTYAGWHTERPPKSFVLWDDAMKEAVITMASRHLEFTVTATTFDKNGTPLVWLIYVSGGDSVISVKKD